MSRCPVPGQDTMDQFNAWQQVAPRTLRTGLVPMRALGSDGVVYLHNNVRLCTANNAEECEPVRARLFPPDSTVAPPVSHRKQLSKVIDATTKLDEESH